MARPEMKGREQSQTATKSENGKRSERYRLRLFGDLRLPGMYGSQSGEIKLPRYHQIVDRYLQH